jgi:hypothetical protein
MRSQVAKLVSIGNLPIRFRTWLSWNRVTSLLPTPVGFFAFRDCAIRFGPVLPPVIRRQRAKESAKNDNLRCTASQVEDNVA